MKRFFTKICAALLLTAVCTGCGGGKREYESGGTDAQGRLDTTPQEYMELQEKAEEYARKGDIANQAYCYADIGSILGFMADPQGALRYLDMADSLLRIAGKQDIVDCNGINRAMTLGTAGNEEEAIRILRDLLKKKSILGNPTAEEIASYNLYIYAGDLPALRRAYELQGACPEPDEEYMHLYESCLAKAHALRGDADSAVYYARKAASRGITEYSVFNYQREFHEGQAYAALAAGQPDSAAFWFRKVIADQDTIAADNVHNEITGLESLRQIDAMKFQRERKESRRIIALLIALVAVVTLAATLLVIYRRRLHRQREKALRDTLEHEHSMRKVLALQIALAENDRLAEHMRKTMDDLHEAGNIDDKGLRTLSETMGAVDVAKNMRESFLMTFSEVNPGFTAALEERFPGLSEAEKRLAIYIALGLDSKHIARLMSIRPESVKQARWRLRSHMGLDPERNLDDEIRSLLPPT